MEEDPIDFKAGDPDKYRYAGNDATNYTDPNGLASIVRAGLELAGTRVAQVPGLDGLVARAVGLAGTKVVYINLANAQIDHLQRLLAAVLQGSYLAIQEVRTLRPYYVADPNLPPQTPLSVRSTDAKVQRWFADYPLKQREKEDQRRLTLTELDTVLKTLESTYNRLLARGLKIEFSPTGVDSVALWSTRLQTMFLGTAFWEKPDRKQAGYLFHELTHAFGNTEDSSTNPAFGRDTYLYAEEQYTPDGLWGLRPSYADPPTYRLEQTKPPKITPRREIQAKTAIQLASAYQGFLEEFYLTSLNGTYDRRRDRLQFK
jgi:hypothetical protein